MLLLVRIQYNYIYKAISLHLSHGLHKAFYSIIPLVLLTFASFSFIGKLIIMDATKNRLQPCHCTSTTAYITFNFQVLSWSCIPQVIYISHDCSTVRHKNEKICISYNVPCNCHIGITESKISPNPAERALVSNV